MKVSIFGDKINVTTIILILIIGMAVSCFTVCSCAGVEGFTHDSLIGSPIGASPNVALLNLFKNSTFSPECCPSTYSNSLGCLCDEKTMHLLNKRGGNRSCCSLF